MSHLRSVTHVAYKACGCGVSERRKLSQEGWSHLSGEDDCSRKVGLIAMATLLGVLVWRALLCVWPGVLRLGAALCLAWCSYGILFRLGAAL